MPVYFFLDSENEKVKIGRAKDVRKRAKQLQTGNPNPMQIMGWIKTENDVKFEQSLHKQYKEQRGHGEWFSIGVDEILTELKRAHYGFVPTKGYAYEIISYDKNAIPEYLGICEWADFEIYECCPFCGCFCGMHEQGDTGMFHCINCDEFTSFDFLSDQNHYD